VTPLLHAARVPSTAVDLPSCARAAEGAGLADDIAAVEATLDGLSGDEPAVLLGHSRGGAVISEAGVHPRVGHLVYLTAGLRAPGIPRPTFNFLEQPFENGTTLPDRSEAARFYAGCPQEVVDRAFERLRPQFVDLTSRPPSREAWRLRPSTYVVCALDEVVEPDRQRAMAAHTSSVVEWQTGHSPFLSHPELVAELVIELASSAN
jgi:pimeloyl-ACP methyl ester carboxylesterase